MVRLVRDFVVLSLALAATVGCEKPARQRSQAERAAAEGRQITGHLVSPASAGQAVVRLLLVLPRGELTFAKSAEVQTDGTFSIPILDADGPYLLEASHPLQKFPYRRYIADSEVTGVVVSPLSTLSAALADHLASTEHHPDFARSVRAAEASVEKHFAVAGLQFIVPVKEMLADDWQITSKNEQTQVALLFRAMRRLHRNFHNLESLQRSDVNTDSLDAFIDVLATDLRADGKVDGFGPNHQRLTIANRTYTGDLLGRSLANALLQEADAIAAKNSTTRDSFCFWATRLASPESAFVDHRYESELPFQCTGHRTVIKGSISGIKVTTNTNIVAYRLDAEGAIGDVVGRSPIAPDNSWKMELEQEDSDLWVEAKDPAFPEPLIRVLVPQAGHQATKSGIHLHPMAAIVSSYTQALMQEESIEPSEAFSRASSAFRQQFGIDVSATAKPQALCMKTFLQTGDNYLPTSQALDLINTAFSRMAVRSGARADGDVARDRVVGMLRALDEDVRADLTFDGFGSDGHTLKGALFELSHDTLKGRLAAELLAVREDEMSKLKGDKQQAARKTGAFSAVQSLANSIVSRNGEPFHPEPAPIDASGPTFVGCSLVDKYGKLSPVDHPQSGNFVLECHFSSTTACRTVSLTHSTPVKDFISTDQNATCANGSMNFAETDTVRFTVDSSYLARNRENRKEPLELDFIAEDSAGFESFATFVVETDNTPPSLQCTSCRAETGSAEVKTHLAVAQYSISVQIEAGCGDTNCLTVSGESSDRAIIELDRRLDDEINLYRLTYPAFPEIAGQQFTVEATDKHKNSQSLRIRVITDGQGPVFEAPSFSPGHDFNPFWTQDSLRHRWHSGSGTFVVHKYANQLDDLPERYARGFGGLPKIAVELKQRDRSAPIRKVEYRAIPYRSTRFLETRGSGGSWRPARREEDGRYVLFIAYQFLLSDEQLKDLATARESAYLLHRGENKDEPAAWVIEFRATDSLGRQAIVESRLLIDARLPRIEVVAKELSPHWTLNLEKNLTSRHQNGGPVAEFHFQYNLPVLANSIFQPRPLNGQIGSGGRLQTSATATAWRIVGNSSYAYQNTDGFQRCVGQALAAGTWNGFYLPGSQLPSGVDLCKPVHREELTKPRFATMVESGPNIGKSGRDRHILQVPLQSASFAMRTNDGTMIRPQTVTAKVPELGRGLLDWGNERWILFEGEGASFWGKGKKVKHRLIKYFTEFVEGWQTEVWPEFTFAMDGSLLSPENAEELFNTAIQFNY